MRKDDNYGVARQDLGAKQVRKNVTDIREKVALKKARRVHAGKINEARAKGVTSDDAIVAYIVDPMPEDLRAGAEAIVRDMLGRRDR